MVNIKEQKAKLRNKIWDLMEEKSVTRFPRPVYGRVPNFEGAEKAAERLKELDEWRKAKTIFANPDSPQKPVRELALRESKVVIMASPRLKKGYLRIEPADVKGVERAAATIKGAFKWGKHVGKKLPKADLVITGSVGVDKQGNRLGKGGGYGDKEIARLKQDKSITAKTPIVTTVHELQIVKAVPSEPHDQKVNIIISPKRIIRVK